MTDHLSNAADYEITMGRLCPYCSNSDGRLIEQFRIWWRCEVCSRSWVGLPEPYRTIASGGRP